MPITHNKTNTIPDWTQGDLDTIISGGAAPLPPPGTVLADIVLPSDWNAEHDVSIETDDIEDGAVTSEKTSSEVQASLEKADNAVQLDQDYYVIGNGSSSSWSTGTDDRKGIVFGHDATSDEDTPTVVGQQASVIHTPYYGIYGIYGCASGNEGVAYGNLATGYGWRTTAIGAKTHAGGQSATALGTGATSLKSHGCAFGRGAYVPDPSILLQSGNLDDVETSIPNTELYFENGWGHYFNTPVSNITIGNVTPSTVTVRLHGQDAFDARYPVWDSGTAYVGTGTLTASSTLANTVQHNNVVYKCIADNTNKEPGVAVDWETYWVQLQVVPVSGDGSGVPGDYNVDGGNIALSAGRSTGTGTGGRAILEVCDGADRGDNVKQHLVSGVEADSDYGIANTHLVLRDVELGQKRRISLLDDGLVAAHSVTVALSTANSGTDYDDSLTWLSQTALSGDFEVTFTLTTAGQNAVFGFQTESTKAGTNNYTTIDMGLQYNTSSQLYYWTGGSSSTIAVTGAGNGSVFRFIRVGTTLTIQHNDTTVSTKTVTSSDVYAIYTAAKSGEGVYTYPGYELGLLGSNVVATKTDVALPVSRFAPLDYAYAAVSGAPSAVGVIYVDQTNSKAYVSANTLEDTDWLQIGGLQWDPSGWGGFLATSDTSFQAIFDKLDAQEVFVPSEVVSSVDPVMQTNLTTEASTSFTIGQIGYVDSSGTVSAADASAESTGGDVMLVMAQGTVGTAAAADFMIQGILTTSGLTAGALYYLSETAKGITTTAPSTTNAVIRVVGYAISSTKFYFNPSTEWSVKS